jgi:hypothetical protein
MIKIGCALFPNSSCLNYPGGFTDGETPLSIPNREVKPIRADGTMLVTAWESRSLPGLFLKRGQATFSRTA